MRLIEKATGQVIAVGVLSINENGAHGSNFMLSGDFLETHELVAYENIVSDEQKSLEVRAERNTKLTASDWTQGKDIPDNVSSSWAVYRQALRDITSQAGFPWSVQWPTQPE
jgi:hypothetical protein